MFNTITGCAWVKLSVRCFTTVVTMESPIVTVKQGKLKGSIKPLLDGTPYFSFKGVPYAQPPIERLRFKAPLPVKPWNGIRDAIEHGPICPQYDVSKTQVSIGSEDCLYLNVYTKSLTSTTKAPVMVYIHGGGFLSGSGNSDTYGPEYLLQHDVVLVTINYRLEAFGFLCLETPEVPGNAGIKDQVVAMRWVKENIANFGGDANNITLFGESAGSGCVTHHMMSPMSKGLFHKAIAQSGVNTQDWAYAYNAKERAFRLGKYLGKDTNDTEELLNFLRSVPAEKLIGVTTFTRSAEEKYRGLPMHFVPVVEQKFEGVDCFLEKNPLDVLIEGKMNIVPLLTGYNSVEGITMINDHLKKKRLYSEQPSYLVPREIALKVPHNKLKEFGDRIKAFYVGNKDFSENTKQEIANVQTDLNFIYNIHRFAFLYHKLAPVYMYRFDYDTDLNIAKSHLGHTKMKGACHADDLFYLFYNNLNGYICKEKHNLQKIVYQLTKLWTDFARTGNPTPSNDGIKWPLYTQSARKLLILNEQFSILAYPERDRVEFWNQLYCEAGLPCITKSSI